MGFQDDPGRICWKLHLHAPAQRVHQIAQPRPTAQVG